MNELTLIKNECANYLSRYYQVYEQFINCSLRDMDKDKDKDKDKENFYYLLTFWLQLYIIALKFF